MILLETWMKVSLTFVRLGPMVPISMQLIFSEKNNNKEQELSPTMMKYSYIDGILPKGPYPTCLRMADRAVLAGYPRYQASMSCRRSYDGT